MSGLHTRLQEMAISEAVDCISSQCTFGFNANRFSEIVDALVEIAVLSPATADFFKKEVIAMFDTNPCTHAEIAKTMTNLFENSEIDEYLGTELSHVTINEIMIAVTNYRENSKLIKRAHSACEGMAFDI